MKKWSVCIVCMLLSLGGRAQGIEFFRGTYAEALQKARTEHKQVFVDVYTSWCGPCKRMAREVFVQPAVGEYYNARYICLKLDAEKEKEHGFFRNYRAAAFPSFFWLDEQGKLLDMQTGYADAGKFIRMAAEAGKSDLNRRMEEGRKRWESGERTPSLIQDYVLGVLGKLDPGQVEPLVMEYVAGLTEEQLRTEENYRILRHFMREAGNNPVCCALIRNAEIYRQYEKGYDFWIYMYRMVVRAGICRRNEPEKYGAYLAFLKEFRAPLPDMYREILDMEYSLFRKDFGKGIPEALALTEKYAQEHPYLAGQFCYTLIIAGFFEEEQVPDKLADQVITLADRALRAVPCKENLLYLCAAYARKGDYKKAYERMASEAFFPDPVLSNALYKHLGLPVFHREYLK